MNRRHFLKSTAVGAGVTAFIGWPAIAAGQETNGSDLYRWFPLIRTPKEIWVVQSPGDVEEGMILESAAGLAARAVLQGHGDILIYEDVQNDGYQRWFEEYCRANSPRVTPLTLDEIVSRLLRAKIVHGYCLYHFDESADPLYSGGNLDESANVATSLAPAYWTLQVSERLVQQIEKLGVKQLLDARGRDERWCLSQRQFSRRVLGTADPRTRDARSLMIAYNAFVCSGRGSVYEEALARCYADSPVLGYGCTGDEFKLTMPSSRWGLFQTATNWCSNLPVFASDVAGESVATDQLKMRFPMHWSALDWGEGKHYVNFTLSDGDNVQWVMGNFTSGSEAPSYYGNPRRGAIPFTWGLPASSLCQLSPRTLAEILVKATPNDDFIHYNGAGYFYPDFYGKARDKTKAIEVQAERLRAYMELTGIRILAFNFQNWDSADAHAACEAFASKLPQLLGIFAFQYYPYSAGKGAIRWVRGVSGDEVPVVSCRFTIWAQQGRPHDSTPAAIAAQLNQLPGIGQGADEDCFSWVIAHAWSRFRRVAQGASLDAEENGVDQDKEVPGTARGFEPVLWAAERLQPGIKPVTAQELLLRLRLRLRPRATLSNWLAEVENQALHSGEMQKVRDLLDKANKDAASARRCFELLKAVYLETKNEAPQGRL